MVSRVGVARCGAWVVMLYAERRLGDVLNVLPRSEVEAVMAALRSGFES